MCALNETLQIHCVSNRTAAAGAAMTVNSCFIGNRYCNDKPFRYAKGHFIKSFICEGK